jgi:hypothetical protein
MSKISKNTTQFLKKGQLTVFIIVGITLIFILAFVLYLNRSNIDNFIASPLNIHTQPINDLVKECLEDLGKEAIYYVSLQGGYYFTPEPYEEYNFLDIPVYLDNGRLIIPSKKEIENHMLMYIEDHLPFCLENFEMFEDLGYNIQAGNINGEIIMGKEISIKVDYPLTIIKEDKEYRMKGFMGSVKFDFFEKYELVTRFFERQMESPNSIPLGFMVTLAEDNDFVFETITLDDNTILYTMVFERDDFEGFPFIYSFINRYNWSHLNSYSSVRIHPIPTIYLEESRNIKFDVKADGENVKFSSESSLIDIHPVTGEVRFDPSYLSNGERNILIKAEDDKGNSDFAFFKLIINYSDNRPIVETIGKQTAMVGEEFYYKINAQDPTNDFLFFHDDSNLFDVDILTGEVRFTPESTGRYIIKFTIINSAGNVFEYMELEVE